LRLTVEACQAGNVSVLKHKMRIREGGGEAGTNQEQIGVGLDSGGSFQKDKGRKTVKLRGSTKKGR